MIITEDELYGRLDDIAAEHPELVARYWQLKSDPDVCPCCLDTHLSFEFGDSAWVQVPELECIVFLLGGR